MRRIAMLALGIIVLSGCCEPRIKLQAASVAGHTTTIKKVDNKTIHMIATANDCGYVVKENGELWR